MKEDGELTPVKEPWVRVEDYFVSLVRRRTARRSRTPRLRTEPEEPRFFLSTLPFLTLIGGLAVLSVAIAVTAWPVRQPPPALSKAAPHELGTAPKGWFQEAQKEFR